MKKKTTKKAARKEIESKVTLKGSKRDGYVIAVEDEDYCDMWLSLKELTTLYGLIRNRILK